jgi:zeta-carotene desaturase
MDVPLLGLPGREWQWAFDIGRLWPGSASHITLVASAADAMASGSRDRLTASALAALKQAFPKALEAHVRRAVIVSEKRATFSVAPGVPARPGHQTAVAGFLLAGDWIGNPLPATIEAAATSGHQAAALAARYLNL